jgi:hypothetical protein
MNEELDKARKLGLKLNNERRALRKRMIAERMRLYEDIMTKDNLLKFKNLVEYCLEIPPKKYQREVLDSLRAMTKLVEVLTPQPPKSINVEKHDHHNYAKPEVRDGKVDITGMDNVIDVEKLPGWDKF